MARQLATAASFGTVAPTIAVDIENSDRTTRLEAAHFRFSRRLREIETQFEAEASKLRQAYAQSGEYGDLVKLGIIDPTKVVRTAFQPRRSRV